MRAPAGWIHAGTVHAHAATAPPLTAHGGVPDGRRARAWRGPGAGDARGPYGQLRTRAVLGTIRQ